MVIEHIIYKVNYACEVDMKQVICLIFFIVFIIIFVGCSTGDKKSEYSFLEVDKKNLRKSLVIEDVYKQIEKQYEKQDGGTKIEGNESSSKDKDFIWQRNKVCVNNSNYVIKDELLNEIYNIINSYGEDISFCVINLKDNMVMGYNPEDEYDTASTIKAPYVLYCLKEIEKGNGSLEEEMVYEEKYFIYGSGLIQNEPIGSVYTIEELIYNTINYSDNIAYNMLNYRFGEEGYNSMLEELGCDEYFLDGQFIWGKANAKSAALIWREIYRYGEESDLGKMYISILKEALYNYIQPGVPQYKTAHKSGWIDEQCHDTGIVYAKNPYVVAIMVDNGGNWSSSYEIELIATQINNIMDDYDYYCNNNS